MSAQRLLSDSTRLIDVPGARTVEAEELASELSRIQLDMSTFPEGALFIRMSMDLPSVLRFFAAFEAGRPVALIDPALDVDVLAELVARFRPAAVVGVLHYAAPPGYRIEKWYWVRLSGAAITPHPDLAVLLPTSGSTGSPKFVRLSRSAILSNAEAIASVLDINADEVAPTSLPLHYSYGLSVLNSHVFRGATVVIEPSGVAARDFWDAVATYKCTSLAGVPYHYEMLRRLKFTPDSYPSLQTLTQAGGKLRSELIVEFNEKIRAAGGRMYVMYGQTEAAPRMATVPADQLENKLGSVGPALPGGRFGIRREDGSETTHPKLPGEVIYRGNNVMMGYAESEGELALGDEMDGVLATGDLGYLDEDRYLVITGRMKRIGKVFGNRVNLDDLERAAHLANSEIGVVAAVPAGDKVVLFTEDLDSAESKALARALSEQMHLHVSGFDVRGVGRVPLLASGKIDYKSLEASV